jgi:hypothetical protein
VGLGGVWGGYEYLEGDQTEGGSGIVGQSRLAMLPRHTIQKLHAITNLL